jgi:hypothetical protein
MCGGDLSTEQLAKTLSECNFLEGFLMLEKW